MVAPALIAAGASLLGGIFGQRSEKRAIAAQNEYNSPVNVRARAEAAGFNPLLFVGPGVGQQVATGSNIMGASIASAGLALADGMDKAKMLEIERSRLAMDRERLDALLTNATIRPRSGGIYAGNVSAPSRGGVGGSNVGASRSGGAGVGGGGSVELKFSASKAVDVPLTPVVQDYVSSSGERVQVRAGPDLDEVASGVAIDITGAWKKHARRVYDVDGLTFGAYLNKAAEGFFLSAPGVGGRYLTADEKPGEYQAAVSKQRAKAVARYKRDLAAGKIPPLQYIKPYR